MKSIVTITLRRSHVRCDNNFAKELHLEVCLVIGYGFHDQHGDCHDDADQVNCAPSHRQSTVPRVRYLQYIMLKLSLDEFEYLLLQSCRDLNLIKIIV